MFCSKCSAQIPDNSKFCGVCGAPVQTTYGQTSYTPPVAKEYTLAEEKESLDNFARLFKYERLAWKIEGIVMLVISCVIGGFGLLAFVGGVAEDEVLAGLGAFYLLYGLLFLPIAIINLKMVSRAEHYMNIVYTDAAAVEERAGSIGMIVLAAFFNNIALIFIIINFVRSKTEKDVLKSAKNRQEAFKRNNNM
jgi:hypothetical protein